MYHTIRLISACICMLYVCSCTSKSDYQFPFCISPDSLTVSTDIKLNFSHTAGFYTENFFLNITTNHPDAIILYTLDGSTPSPHNIGGTSFIYTQQYKKSRKSRITEFFSLFFSGNHVERVSFREFISDILDFSPKYIPRTIQSFVLADSIEMPSSQQNSLPISQIVSSTRYYYTPPTGIFDCAVVIQAIAIAPGNIQSPVYSQTYFIGTPFLEYTHIPILSLIVSEYDLFNYERGIYVPGIQQDPYNMPSLQGNQFQRGRQWERPVHVSLFDTSTHIIFSQHAGIRIHGKTSRQYAHKSFRLYARNRYDTSSFLFPFEHSQTQRRVILRTSGQDHDMTYFRDALAAILMKNSKLLVQDYIPVHLFLNGEYWGLINVRERIDNTFFTQEFGIPKHAIELVQNWHFVPDDYQQFRQYLDTVHPQSNTLYTTVTNTISLPSFIDKTIADVFFGNIDIHWKMWRNKTDENPQWKWILWDMDCGFDLPIQSDIAWHTPGNISINHLQHYLQDYRTEDVHFELQKLLQNTLIQQEFIARFTILMNSYLSPHTLLYTIDSISNMLAPAMPFHISRWKESEGIPSLAQWKQQVEQVRNFSLHRHNFVYEHLTAVFNLQGISKVSIMQPKHADIYVSGENLCALLATQLKHAETWTARLFYNIPIELYAVPHANKTFKGWYCNGVLISKQPRFIYIPTQAEYFIEAVFE